MKLQEIVPRRPSATQDMRMDPESIATAACVVVHRVAPLYGLVGLSWIGGYPGDGLGNFNIWSKNHGFP